MLAILTLSAAFAIAPGRSEAHEPSEPNVELRYLDARDYPTISAFIVVIRSGVDPESMVVEEEGDPRAATVKELANEPIAISIVLDSSSSMGFNNKAASALAAVGHLLTTVRPFDPVGLVTFADVATAAAPASTDRSPIRGALGAYSPNGGTAFRDAVGLAIDQLRSVPATRRIVLALSDGLDNRSLITQDQLVAKATENGVAVWTVGFGIPGGVQDEGIDVAALEDLANRTGGRPLITPDAVAVENGFRQIAAQVQRELHVQIHSRRAADGTTRTLTFLLGSDLVTVEYNPGGVVPVAVPSVAGPHAESSGPSIAARVSVASRWWLVGLALLAVAAAAATQGDHLARRAWFDRRWTRTLTSRDPDVGHVCANEGDLKYVVAVGDRVVTCPQCRAVHHFDCWRLNDDHCFTAHCRGSTPARKSTKGGRYTLRDVGLVGLALGGAFLASERSGPFAAAVLRTSPDDFRERFAVQIAEAAFGFLLALSICVPVRAFSDAGHLRWRRAIARAVLAALPAALLAAASLVAADQFFRGLGRGDFARVVSWGLVGACIGIACLGGRVAYLLRGAGGGLVGGVVGGALLVGLQRTWDPALAAIPGVALVAAGAALGAFGLARALERAWLEGIGGSVAGRVFPLDKYLGGPTAWAELGSASRKVQLWAKELAETHARIGLDGAYFVVEDLGGGVVIDGSPVRRSHLRDGSILDLGGARFRYRERRR